MSRVTEVAHLLVDAVLQPGAQAVDATVGNGHDTLRLAHSVGPSGRVDGFDIQSPAIVRTRRRLEAHGVAAQVRLHQRGHEDMEAVLPRHRHGKVGAVMFNLGYLPRSDQAIVTRPETTLRGLAAAVRLLRPGGILTVVAYLRHDGGRLETEHVWAWGRSLDPTVCVVSEYRVLTAEEAPQLLVVEKRAAPVSPDPSSAA